MNKGEGLVEVYTATGEAEAQIIRGLLESQGIPSLLRSPAAPSVHPFTVDGMGQVRIMVPRSMAEQAMKLIRRKEDA